MSDWQDVAKQHILVRATARQVWALVSVPGWFISNRTGAPGVEKIDERLTLIRDEKWGLRVIRTVGLTEPSYAAFRWEVPGDSLLTPTLVQFWITEQGAGTVLLTVRESGLTAEADGGDEAPGTLAVDNDGWADALEAVRRYFKGGTRQARPAPKERRPGCPDGVAVYRQDPGVLTPRLRGSYVEPVQENSDGGREYAVPQATNNGGMTMPENDEVLERIHSLEVAQATAAGEAATQAATQAGGMSTQAATQAGAATTQAASVSGLAAAVAAGAVAFVVGIFVGVSVSRK